VTIYHVFANRSNVGDWLSARGIQSLLAPLSVVELLCDEPFVPQTLERLSAAGPDDLVVIGGGGLFMDYFEPFWQGFALVAARVPFCIWGVGCCDLKRSNSRLPQSLIGPIASRARLCVVRDKLSRDFLSGHTQARVVACPTLNVLGTRPPGDGVLHVDAYDDVGQEAYELMNRAGADFAACAGRPFRTTNNLVPAGNERALDGVLGRYAEAGAVLTSRLHGCIIGLAMGRKVLAVSGDHKVEAFMSAVGLGEWVLGPDELNSLPGRLAALADQPSPALFLDLARRENELVGEEARKLAQGGQRPVQGPRQQGNNGIS
jgi:hypothetical protein